MEDHDERQPTARPLQQPGIRSFVVRAGRMTTGQQKALDDHWPRYGIDYVAAPLDLDALFGRRAPRVLEIGFGNGDHLADLAEARPEQDFIGIEVHPPGIGHLLQQAAARGLGNLRVACHDAVEVLLHQIPADALDEVLLLFPDPWHKKRHHKRRIVQDAFVDLVVSRLKVGGVFRMATDWVPYAEHMLEVLGRNPRLRNLSTTNDYVPRYADRATTRFERRGERLGHEVRDLAFERIS